MRGGSVNQYVGSAVDDRGLAFCGEKRRGRTFAAMRRSVATERSGRVVAICTEESSKECRAHPPAIVQNVPSRLTTTLANSVDEVHASGGWALNERVAMLLIKVAANWPRREGMV